MVEHGDYGDRHQERSILKPHPIFDQLYARKGMRWFGTKTYLFPGFAERVVDGTDAYAPRNQILLLSFASMEDAMIARLLLPSAIILPEEWWLEFKNAEYRRHPIFPEFEVTETALIRVDGQQLDTSPSERMEVRSRKLRSPVGWEHGISRPVIQLVQDTWCVPTAAYECGAEL
jgi:hypothetical protein